MRSMSLLVVIGLLAACGGPSPDVPDAPPSADAGVHVETLPPVRLRQGLRRTSVRGGLEVVEARDGSALVLISGAEGGVYAPGGPAYLVALDSRGAPLSELPTLPPEFVALRARVFAGGWLVWSGAGSAWATVSPRGELTVLADAPRRCGLEAWPTGESITVLSAPEGCRAEGPLELQELGADGRWSAPRPLEVRWSPSLVQAALGATGLVVALENAGGRALYEADPRTGALLRTIPLEDVVGLEGASRSVSSARVAADGSARFLAWRTSTEPVLLALGTDGIVTHPIELPCSQNGPLHWSRERRSVLLGETHVRCFDRDERGDWLARLGDDGRVSEAELLPWSLPSDFNRRFFDRSWPSGLSASIATVDEGETEQELLVIPAGGDERSVPIAPRGPHHYSANETLTRAPWGAVVRLGSRLVLVRSDGSVASEVEGSSAFAATEDGVISYVEGSPEAAPSFVAYGLDGGVRWRREEVLPTGHVAETPRAVAWTSERLVTVYAPSLVQIRDAMAVVLSERVGGFVTAADDGRVLIAPLEGGSTWEVLDRDGTVLARTVLPGSWGSYDRSCGASCWTGLWCGTELRLVDGALVAVERDCPAGFEARFAPGATSAGERALVRVGPLVGPPACAEITGVTWLDREGTRLVDSPLGPVDYCGSTSKMIVRPDGELWVLRSPPWAVRPYEEGFLELFRARLVRDW